jgi:hypothetical protein
VFFHRGGKSLEFIFLSLRKNNNLNMWVETSPSFHPSIGWRVEPASNRTKLKINETYCFSGELVKEDKRNSKLKLLYVKIKRNSTIIRKSIKS